MRKVGGRMERKGRDGERDHRHECDECLSHMPAGCFGPVELY